MNFTLRQKRVIRSVLCGLLLASIFAYLSTPREILKAQTGWIPDSKEWRVPWTHAYCLSVTPNNAGNASGRSIEFQYHPSLQAVQLKGPLSDSSLDQLQSLPLLHTLTWSNIRSVDWIGDRFDEMPSLVELSISFESLANRPSDAPESQATLDFRRMKSLISLGIQGIHGRYLDSELLASPRLRSLSIELIGWNQTTLKIEEFQFLQELSIVAPREGHSSVSIQVANMPSLVSLLVPGFQPIELSVENVPKLRQIETVYSSRRRDDDQVVRSDIAPWLDVLSIQNAEALSDLCVAVYAPKAWKVVGCPKLRSFTLSPPSLRRLRLLDVVTREEETRALLPIWKWLESDLPLNSISLEKVDLRQVNLSSWDRMTYLTDLAFSRCRFRPGQIGQAAALASLERIVAPHVRLTTKSARRILSSGQRWERLDLDWSQMDTIRIVDHPNLITAFQRGELNATGVVLKALPRFRSNLILKENLEQLVIEDVPEISTLVINGQLPSNTRLSGVEGLRKLYVRENLLSNSFTDVLRSAESLHTLYLTGCEIEQNLLDLLPQKQRLMLIDLSGTRV